MTLASELVENLGMSLGDVSRVIESAPARYFVFDIPKRNGGLRTIAQPSRELKAIQRFVLAEKLHEFPVHRCATAYVKGSSILNNASSHVDAGPILKLDFADFFPSLKTSDWLRLVRRNSLRNIEKKDIPLYTKILFWSASKNDKTPRCLSIGAPTSPTLSNILLHDLDTELSEYADSLGVNYTRYADDITISAEEATPMLRFETLARKAVAKRKSPALTFNESKRGFYTKSGRRTVTGLVITPDKKISLGRERKRTISAMLNHLRSGTLSQEGRALLKGMLGFSISVEVSFVERLRSKYGDKLVDSALRHHIPPRRTILTKR